MHTRLKLALLVLAATSAVHAAGQSAAPAEAGKPPLTITISTPRNTVKSGSAVLVDVEVTNTSGSIIKIAGGRPAELAYTVDVLDGAAKSAPLTGYGSALVNHKTTWVDKDGQTHSRGGGSVIIPMIPPGGSVKEQLRVTDMFDLSRPGTYTIQVRRPDFRGQPPVSRVLKSNIITVTVTE